MFILDVQSLSGGKTTEEKEEEEEDVELRV